MTADPSLEASPARPGVTRTTEDLWEIIRYQRSKTQIAETECEQARLEVRRLTQRSEHIERQLEETRALLVDERARSEMYAQTAAQHADVLAKLETMHLLQDSNRVLREDKGRADRELTELRTR